MPSYRYAIAVPQVLFIESFEVTFNSIECYLSKQFLRSKFSNSVEGKE